MGIYLNPGNQGFWGSINSQIYIDKTGLISYTNKCLSTEQRFICVSRPRRFGKSMTLKMLAAYYGSGYDSRTLFEPYKIANDENSLSCVISLAYYAARKDYVMYRELPAGTGYVDMVFLPRNGTALPPIIVELKYDKSIEAAMAQIHDRNYMDCLKDYTGKMLLVGINYDAKSTGKKHNCVIEEWDKG